MKIKKVLLFSICLCLALFSASVLVFPRTSNQAYADEVVELRLLKSSSYNQTPVMQPAGNNFTFAYDVNDIFTLKLVNTLNSGDSIQYYYYKEGDFKYTKIPAGDTQTEVVITNYLKSIGSYKFFAKLNNQLSSQNNIYTINITQGLMQDLNLTVRCDEVAGESGQMNSYRLTLLNNEEQTGFNIDNVQVLWYLDTGAEEVLVRSGNSVLFKPLMEGKTKIKVTLLQNGTNLLEEADRPVLDFMARKNNSADILWYVLGAVGLMTIGLVISIVVKIKNEKVW